MEMTIEKLRQYPALIKEIQNIDKSIDKLLERAQDIPVVMGKISGSMQDHPYIQTHISIEMDEPREADAIDRRLRIKRQRRVEAAELAAEIEQFIAGISDSTDRQIFEMIFLERKKQREVAEAVCLERSAVSKRIKSQLSHNSQKSYGIVNVGNQDGCLPF